ncbi:hypothetical protein EZV62_014223 [Acer yangbiense]|uniref:ZF-HD dimerization-type domain-containing protein n=1 Tax=Acer yangbiense TaxID=1000413 RepID=A0A5C7HRP4_9ROSI|nr:hypothetical protein EZV62_014223 [Acer yangbiense]
MEVRGTPSYLGHHHHHHNRDSSSSKISPSTPPTTTTTTVHDHGVGDAIFNLSQTLDHHHHHHQSNVNPVQDTHDNIPRRSRRDPDTDPDPVPATASIATSSSTERSTPTTATTTTTLVIRYRECLKNHAASMGRHVVDGCGEFMPGIVGGGGGEEEAEGNSEALKCAACECHRNFHRKEINGHGASSQSQLLLYQPANSYYNNKKYHHHRHNHNHHHHHHQQQQQQQPPPALPPPAIFYDHHNNNNNSRLALGLTNSTTPAAPLMMVFGGGGAAAEYSSSGDLNMFNSNAEGGQSTVLMQPKYSKKRFRTKFSQEQKEKMMELAEKIGWRIQKQDEKEVQEFCAQVGVKRQVFKVWMHNNKQASVKNKE